MEFSSDGPAAPLARFPGASVRRVQSRSGVAVEAVREGTMIHMRRPGEDWITRPSVMAFATLIELLGLDGTDSDQAAEAHLLLRVINAGGVGTGIGGAPTLDQLAS